MIIGLCAILRMVSDIRVMGFMLLSKWLIAFYNIKMNTVLTFLDIYRFLMKQRVCIFIIIE